MIGYRPAYWRASEWLTLARTLVAPTDVRAIADLIAAIPQGPPGAAVLPMNAARTGLKIAMRVAREQHPARNEVIVPAYVCPSVPQVLRECGLSVRFAPVGADLNMDISAAAEMAGPLTLAIVAVHMYGCPTDVSRLASVVGGRDIVIVDDAAQVIAVNDAATMPLGASGDFGLHSFALFKTICVGESGSGGILRVNTPRFVAAAQRYVDALPPHPEQVRWPFLLRQITGREWPTLIWRLQHLARLFGSPNAVGARQVPEVQMAARDAALALTQWQNVDAVIEAKTDLLSRFRTILANIPGIRLPQLQTDQYLTRLMVEVEGGAGPLRAHLRAHGVPARAPYPSPTDDEGRPILADRVARLLEIPTPIGMTDANLEWIAGMVNHFMQQREKGCDQC